ncbi:GNAT family N-acetyltransferase [Halovulum dunhuangense]|uniref:GNAT family N-acetyltransferase n=1 Tax=Halovulum dunhuangense TaxID=1505036 RepID=A0A849L5I4_9RHOB|nr:GNAT family N-acetyltransferase [Halovulum dunhuangense]NNU81442.1 GNAT family N-acetyltransferase [Halovulum dunhuangense]
MPDGQIHFNRDGANENGQKRRPVLKVTTVKTIEDMMRVTSIRAAVYMAEQDCPYEEEFDGNDFCATHLIGWVDGEPVACLRLRWFGGFAKMERVAVRPRFRKTRIAFKMIRFGIEHAHRKGFSRIIGHARDELIPLYRLFGFRVDEDARSLVFSDYSYTEMVLDGDLPENAITLRSCPYALIRPEGDWDRPGILEKSVDRTKTDTAYAMAAE